LWGQSEGKEERKRKKGGRVKGKRERDDKRNQKKEDKIIKK
jgi:hypothetical protein